MFNASAAYDAFLLALAPSFETTGFKCVKSGFRRRNQFAQLDVPLTKARNNRRDCLVCNLGVTVNLKALDPYFRPKNQRDSMSGNSACDFFTTYFDLAGRPPGELGYWTISSDADLTQAIVEATHCVPAILRFLEPFEAEPDILAKLRRPFLERNVVNILGKLAYPAYLIGTGRRVEFDKAFTDLLAVFNDDERFVTAISRARQKMERISQNGHTLSDAAGSMA